VRWVVAERPDVVVTTHFFPADVVGALRRSGRLSSRFLIAITDLFPHRMWVAPEADVVAVGSEMTRQVCGQRGIPSERLRVTGIPVGSRFGQPVERTTVYQRLGLDPSRRTLLITSGGMGYGPIEGIVTGLVASEMAAERLQILVVCGNNHTLAARLERRCHEAPVPVRIFGFVETMPELMQASDLLVTKAGGLTIMEALTVGLPMVLCGIIPGQESLNAEYVVSQGAAVSAPHPRDAVARALQLVEHPEQLEAMRQKAKRLSRPHAADDIVALLTR